MYARPRLQGSARSIAGALALVLALSASDVSPARAAGAPHADDARALAIAQTVAVDLHVGRLDRSRLMRSFDAIVSEKALATLAHPFERLSTPFTLTLYASSDRDGMTMRTYVLSASDGEELVSLGLDDATGKIGAFYARPGPSR